jgi:hypothetical protein
VKRLWLVLSVLAAVQVDLVANVAAGATPVPARWWPFTWGAFAAAVAVAVTVNAVIDHQNRSRARVQPPGGDVNVRLHLAAPALLPWQIPNDVAAFTGREECLAMLDRLVERNGGAGSGTMVISAIAGMAGVGKPESA